MNTGHLLQLSEAYWRLDVVPQIDEMVRQRVSPREYERYRQDPERPALLQELRAHEIGGRRIEDVLDAITAGPSPGRGRSPRCSTAAWEKRSPRRGGRRRPGLSAYLRTPRSRSGSPAGCSTPGRPS